MRDLLEAQIIADANQGDTTVLASLLEMLTDTQVYEALGDKEQSIIKCYYDVHINCGKESYSIGVICPYPMGDEDIIKLGFEQDLFDEASDAYNVDSIEGIGVEEYNEWFNNN